jgi:hypothetical protein
LTDLFVGGGFAGQLLAGLCCFAGQDTDKGTSLMMPPHQTKIASTVIIFNHLPLYMKKIFFFFFFFFSLTTKARKVVHKFSKYVQLLSSFC